jgi:phosphoserine aminotransferase
LISLKSGSYTLVFVERREIIMTKKLTYQDFVVPKELIPTDPRFGCGPSLIPIAHLESLLQTGTRLLGTSHRRPSVKAVMRELQEGIAQYFQLPPETLVAIGNGGATLLFDMIGLGMVDKKILHYTCGEFSEKWHQSSAKIPWIQAEMVQAPYGEGVVYRGQTEAPDVIAVTLNETSTGVQLESLPDLRSEGNQDTLLAVDATSGAGQVFCDVNQTDIFFFSLQKVFGSEGGLWVAILSERAQRRALEIEGRPGRYIPGIMSWKNAMEKSQVNETYNTPAISTLFFAREQIREMNQMGYAAVCAEAKRKAELLYQWAKEKPYLSCYVKNAACRSTAVCCIDVDLKYPVDPLISLLEKAGVVYGIEGYRKLGRNQFRIAIFHNVLYEDLVKLTKIISLAIESENE